ncbi:hypothetical protein FQZ97_1237740 [compost metagenome]
MIGDEPLLFEARRDRRQARSRFDAEGGFLLEGPHAIELGRAIDHDAPGHEQANDQQGQQAVENIDKPIAGTAALGLAVSHRAGSPW